MNQCHGGESALEDETVEKKSDRDVGLEGWGGDRPVGGDRGLSSWPDWYDLVLGVSCLSICKP